MQGIIIENIANLYQVKLMNPKEEASKQNESKEKSCLKNPSPMAKVAKQTRN